MNKARGAKRMLNTKDGGKPRLGNPIPRSEHTAPFVDIKPVESRVDKVVVNGKGQGRHGRPSLYDNTRFPHIAETLCREYGMTNDQLAPIFGVTEPVIYSWKRKYPDFAAALIRGRDDFDGQKVENALLKRALGYGYTEKQTKTVTVKAKHKYDDYEICIPAVETIVLEKELPPDVKAIQFWLTNRQQDRWKMVTIVKANINAKTEHVKKTLNVSADLSKMDVEQLKALREMVSTQSPELIEGEVIDVKAIDWIEELGIVQEPV